ncbi:hypothetical protein WAI453_005577 [Rhynchosporium graminicola]
MDRRCTPKRFGVAVHHGGANSWFKTNWCGIPQVILAQCTGRSFAALSMMDSRGGQLPGLNYVEDTQVIEDGDERARANLDTQNACIDQFSDLWRRDPVFALKKFKIRFSEVGVLQGRCAERRLFTDVLHVNKTVAKLKQQ